VGGSADARPHQFYRGLYSYYECFIKEQTRRSLARVAAADGERALKRIYGRLYEDMCQDLGWMDPAELLDVAAWSEIARDLARGGLGGAVGIQRVVREKLDECAEEWVRTNPIS
jgi:hypothetical protein